MTRLYCFKLIPGGASSLYRLYLIEYELTEVGLQIWERIEELP